MAVLQRCSKDRSPIGLPQWIGPINNPADPEEARAWIERGDWNLATLPQHLQSPLNWLHVASSRNYRAGRAPLRYADPKIFSPTSSAPCARRAPFHELRPTAASLMIASRCQC